MSVPDYDLAIIGGGIQGFYTAYLASQRWPERSCAIFDKSSIGSGASHFAPGIQLAYGRNEAEQTLSVAGQRAWRQIFSDWEWRPGKELELNWITQDPKQIIGCATEPLKVRRSEKSLGALGKLNLRPEQSVLQGICSYDPVKSVLSKFATELTKGVGHIYENTNIVQIKEHEGNCLELISADGQHFTCRQAVVALGPWMTSSPLASMCQSIADVRIKKVVSLMLDIPPSPDAPALALADDYAFVLPLLEEGKWLFSFASEDWDVTPEDKFALISNDIEKAKRLLERYQLPDNFDLSATRIFCDSYTPNGLPRVEPADYGLPISFIFGGGGNGFRFAPPLAEAAFTAMEP